MAFGDSEIQDAVFKKLDPWLNNIVDYADVEAAYKSRGVYHARKIELLHAIEKAENAIVTEVDKPRSNETRIKKLEATRELREWLSEVEQKIAVIDNKCKLLEFKRDMLKNACYRTKVQFDL